MTSASLLNTSVPLSLKHKSIPSLIKFYAEKLAGKVAIKQNNETLTYKEFNQNSNKIAAYFIANNLKPGDIVAVAMDRSIQMATCLLAIMKAGATYIPVDPSLPAERTNFIINDSAAKIVVTSNSYQAMYANHRNKIIFDDIWLKSNAYADGDLNIELSDDHLAYIIYTSGSTGFPKGVAIPHTGLLNLLLSRKADVGVNETDIILGITTMSFDIAEEELFLPLINGAQLTIADNAIAKDGHALLQTVRAENITLMQGTPYIWQMMLEAGWDDRLPIKAYCGGEAMTKELAEKLLARCDGLWNMYGPTETTICSIAKKITTPEEVKTIGKPISNTWVYILDEDLNEVLPGVEGEICIGGAGVAKGYMNRPDLTAEKFVEDKFSGSAANKMYRTGDAGKTDENGEIIFLGRIDFEIKYKGYRIETEEIDYQLRQLENVKDSLVVINKKSASNVRLVAYVKLKSSVANDANYNLFEDWKNKLNTVLPNYMIPTDFMIIKEIPLLPSGKVDRKALPEPVIESNPSLYAAPETQTEQLLTDIWKECLSINIIGINDNFFDLGGDSLTAVIAKVKTEKITQKRLSPSVLFKYPTIKQLAAVIDDITSDELKSLVPIKPDGCKIPLYIVHGINLNVLNFRNMVLNLDIEQPVYGLQAVTLEEYEKLNTIEDIAAFYNNEIISSDPHGPYAIAGYSIGGVIAYEMVKQLKLQGKDVKMLALFDTNLQTSTQHYPIQKKISRKLKRQVAKFKFRLRSFPKHPAQNISYLKAAYTNKLYAFLTKLGMPHADELPLYMRQIIQRLKDTFYKYDVKPYDVKIDLFMGKNYYFVDDPQFLGWKDYALQGITVHKIPGDHDKMLKAPNDKVFAQKLQARLDEINEEPA